MRICSLLPSATEIVCALGLQQHLVAVTHECDFPPPVMRLPRVTRSALDHRHRNSSEIHRHISQAVHQGSSIYELDQSLLQQLEPDLILTQELCGVCAVSYQTVRRAVRLLRGKQRILSLEPTALAGIVQTIREVGQLTGVQERAQELASQLESRVEQVRQRATAAPLRPRVLALEWLDPLFVGGHWIPEMIAVAGGHDGVGTPGSPSLQVGREAIERYQPEIIVLMPCGFNLEGTLREWRQTGLASRWASLPALAQNRLFAVDGSAYFNRPGPRIVEGLEMLAEIIHPQLFPRRPPGQGWELVRR